MTFLRHAVDNGFSRAYLLVVAAVEGWLFLGRATSPAPSSNSLWQVLPALPTSWAGALAVVGLGGERGPYWWLFPVSIGVGAVLNAAVIGTLVQARRTPRPPT